MATLLLRVPSLSLLMLLLCLVRTQTRASTPSTTPIITSHAAAAGSSTPPGPDHASWPSEAAAALASSAAAGSVRKPAPSQHSPGAGPQPWARILSLLQGGPSSPSSSSRSSRRRLAQEEGRGTRPALEAAQLLQLRPACSHMSKCRADPDGRLAAADFPQSPRLEWVPTPGKYLLAVCQYGRLSNHLICMRAYFWMAALLNRTLVIPGIGLKDGAFYGARSYKWHWKNLFDFGNMRRCLQHSPGGSSTGTAKESGLGRQPGRGLGEQGGKARSMPPHVLTVEEFLQQAGTPCVQINRLLGFLHRELKLDSVHILPGICRLEGAKELIPQTRPGLRLITRGVLDDLRKLNDSVISLGTLYGIGIEGHNTGAPSAPFELARGCSDLWSPPSALLSLTDRAVKAFAGEQPYAALHLRRGDFRRVYTNRTGIHYPTIPEVARTVKKWMQPLKMKLLYVASDASPVEMQNLKELLQDEKLDWPITVQDINAWHKDVVGTLESSYGDETGLILSILEKYISVHAQAFLATSSSTFSRDILRIRAALSEFSCRDSFLAMTVETGPSESS